MNVERKRSKWITGRYQIFLLYLHRCLFDGRFIQFPIAFDDGVFGLREKCTVLLLKNRLTSMESRVDFNKFSKFSSK